MSISKHSKPNEEEVLLAFAVEPVHDQETLTRYLRDYPEYSTALADLSIEFMIEDSRKEPETLSSDAAADSAWEKFCSVIEIDNIEAIDPFSDLNAIQLKKVADMIGINKLMLIRIRDRGIDYSTIPIRFIEIAAVALGVTIDNLKSYLNGPPKIASDLSFSSDVKPKTAEQISFDKAIQTSQLTSEQQAQIKKMLEG